MQAFLSSKVYAALAKSKINVALKSSYLVIKSIIYYIKYYLSKIILLCGFYIEFQSNFINSVGNNNWERTSRRKKQIIIIIPFFLIP